MSSKLVKRSSSSIETDITVYGATGFTAKHIITYLMQSSVFLLSKKSSRKQQKLRVTLAGRNRGKLSNLRTKFSERMKNLKEVMGRTTEEDNYLLGCEFDVFVADSEDGAAIRRMVSRSSVLLNAAGPFERYGSRVVAACASLGTDYVDITGEISWAGAMRLKHGPAATVSGARIISFCGFDSVPSDLAVLAAIRALQRETAPTTAQIDRATTWHACHGTANGGTINTVAGMPLDLGKLFRWPVPFLVDDPLILTHPRFRHDPDNESVRNKFAKSEWFNQLPTFDTVFKMGVSLPFFMAVCNSKIVQASSVALKYGPNFVYRERHLPMGFKMTMHFKILSIIPALMVQLAILIGMVVLRMPLFGPSLANWLAPPGSGPSDQDCKAGHAEVYAEVVADSTTKNRGFFGKVAKANCLMKFQGDPGNWVTAQCVAESALALLLDGDRLPERSADGFGTPAELLGQVLLDRLQHSRVRPVEISTSVRQNTNRTEWRMFGVKEDDGDDDDGNNKL